MLIYEPSNRRLCAMALALCLNFFALWKLLTLEPPKFLIAETPVDTLSYNPIIKVDDFYDFYTKAMRDMAICQIKGKCPVRLLIYECSDSSTIQCGGLGDRFRGLASLFYAAYSSKRVLLINWTSPADFGQLFNVNENLYGFDFGGGQSLLSILLGKVSDRQKEAEHRRGLFYYNISDASLLVSNQAIVRFVLVSLDLMDQTFTRPVFKRKNDEILQNLQMETISFDLAVYLALNVLLKHPTDWMKREMKLINHDRLKQKRCQVGTHLRASPKNIFNRYVEWPRVSKQQIEQCFAQQIIQVARKSNCTLVYIASDSIEAKQWLQKKLEQEGIESYYAQSVVS